MLESTLRKLRLKDDDVLNVYVVGSRLWHESKSESSDYDLLIVLRGEDPLRQSLHSGAGAASIDATVESAAEFRQRLSEHRFLELLSLWLPRRCVWRERMPPGPLLRRVDVRLLRNATADECERDWRVARKFCEKGEHRRALRTLGHTLRMLRIAQCIATKGIVADYGAGNADFAAALALESRLASAAEDEGVSAWSVCEAELRPRCRELLAAL